uniref:Psp operon transcriptional activator n=1 Tax=Klebsiella pneumoniae TaxID=573 RepID=A0A8B0SW94_KLEPN|nr:Psp operon transcriptional activator [Klebsiella pneumoniae]
MERSVYRHGTSDYPLNEIVIDPFRRHAAPPLAQETRHTSVTLPLDLREFQQQQEKEFFCKPAYSRRNLIRKKAAELLGLTYHQLRALLKKHQI